MLVASITSQLARRDFLFSDHEQVLTAPEDLCTIRAQNCALFLLTNNDKHLKDVVAAGDQAHESALNDMKGRWKHPIKGMGWYKKAKRDFAALPEE